MKENIKIRSEAIQLLPGESFRLLRWADNVQDVEAIGGDGRCHPFRGVGNEWHHHAQLELTLVTRGSGTRFVGDDITHFKASDLVLIGPNLPHYWHGLHNSSGYAVQFDFTPEAPLWQVAETQLLYPLLKEAQRGLHFAGATATEIAGLVRTMADCGGAGRLGIFLQILGTLSKGPAKNRKVLSGRTFAPSSQQAVYRGIQKAINIVFHRFHEELYFADVLRETGMSKATFERQFRKHTGKNFTRFVMEVRLNFACRRLIETGLTIGEIAFESGFNNLSHFNHKFIEQYGQTPTAFRKAHSDGP